MSRRRLLRGGRPRGRLNGMISPFSKISPPHTPHGSPRSNTEYLFANRSDGYLRQFTAGGKADAHADLIVFGHTHVPYRRVVDSVHFVNTGSIGRPKDGDPRAGYCILTVDGNDVSSEQVRLPYDIELACARLIAAGLPEYFAEYLRKGGEVSDSWLAEHDPLAVR